MSELDDIPLGVKVEDRISNAKGIVIEKAEHISGCNRIAVREVDETPHKGEKSHFYPSQLNIISENTEFTEDADDVITESDHLKLGYRARDRVTAATGVIAIINTGLYKTPDAALVSCDEDSNETTLEWFDDVRLEIVSSEPVWSFDDDTDREVTEETTGAAGSSSPDREFSP